MYSANECTSSSTSISHQQSKTNNGITAARNNDVLSRKRVAARQLPRIMLQSTGSQSDNALNTSTANDYSQGILMFMSVYLYAYS